MLDAMISLATSSTEVKKEIFTRELLKSGVEAQRAVEAAHILANELTDEQLTSEQIAIVKAACAKCLKERKRQKAIDKVI